MDISGTLMATLGMEFTVVTPERVEATMPVDERTRQPFGYLHGGATAALLETVASYGGLLNADLETEVPFGVELAIRHRRSARHGIVRGIATLSESEPGRQIWAVECIDAEGTVLSLGTCTVRIVPRPPEATRPQQG